MTSSEILHFLQSEIHSAVFATLDGRGLPRTCVIDLMLADESGLTFLTARGKPFYDRLMVHPYVSISGMKGQGTLSTVAVTVSGPVQNIGKDRLGEIFEKNPYMAEIYPSVQSREALEVFCLGEGEGEFFDLSQLPPSRQAFSFGGHKLHTAGYQISAKACIGCQACRSVCPTGCISKSVPRAIDPSHCIQCGNCYQACPVKAVKKRN